ncbi:glutamate--tRNA ligase [Fretibacter rubidus]|uniref:glutamate--tRNA ligase n=1 Tax=Fretibacter rubidus TaxID=570162 RepID=UPI00352A7297
MTKPKIITRFAPSPTGFLHIGGARTALFNYYFAKHVGGEFHLRIEDTDKARSTEAATQAILDGLDWLGLSYDGDIVFQSRNAEAHVAAAHALLESGKAYRCYLTPKELEAIRETPSDTAFRSPYRDSTEVLDKPFTVRFRVPDGQTKIHDHVQGDITWDNENFDDLVLLRADGTPTYMLAVVVDDHNMGVTHVVRGDDHLINAGRQSQIYDALEWDIPDWAHVPLIHGPDGKKLSKRHGALGVEAYRDMGYLPGGLRNYLLKLGWAHGDNELFFTDDDIAKVFTLDGINSAPARLDFDKMDYINAQHIAQADNADLFAKAQPFFETANGAVLNAIQTNRVKAAMDSLKPRAKILKDLPEQAEYLLSTRPLSISGKSAKIFRKDGVLDLLRSFTLTLKSLKDSQWTQDSLQSAITKFAEQNDIGFGKIGQPVRAALTAGAPSPDLSLVLALLGKDEVIGRIDDVLSGHALTE